MSWLFGHSKSTVVDAITGLSEQDGVNIIDSWSLFRQDVRSNSVGLFQTLFTKHPEYQKLFPVFANDPVNQLHENPCAMAHALAFVYFFTAMVDNIDDKDTLVEFIKKNVRNHMKRRVRPEHFVHLGVVIVEQLKAKMSLRMTPSVVTSWQRFFAFHDMVARQAFKELSEAAPSF
ncbi:putative globin [Ixodes scapularis]